MTQAVHENIQKALWRHKAPRLYEVKVDGISQIFKVEAFENKEARLWVYNELVLADQHLIGQYLGLKATEV